jgi:monoamine oxidase
MEDVIIIGAGMAGLTAASSLKRQGYSVLVLEAGDELGGRGLSRRLASGNVADLGAHWLHGEDNPLRELLDYYRIPYKKDKAEHLYIYKDGHIKKSSHSRWLEQMVDKAKAKRIEEGFEPDCAVIELAKDQEGKEILSDFTLMWNGLEKAIQPSAYEFITDKSKPGGLEIDGGIIRLMEALADDIGTHRIMFNDPVCSITEMRDGVLIITAAGEEFKASRAVLTASIAAFEHIQFDPSLPQDLQHYISSLAVGKMNKIVIEMDPEFFALRNIPRDMSVELLDGEVPHFCHLYTGGVPFINLFVSGKSAERIEYFTPAQAMLYARDILAPIQEISGFEEHMVSEPIISRWVGNPYTQSSYLSALPGAKRRGPYFKNHLCICGDSFDTQYPASLAGAYLSAKKAAKLVAESFRPVMLTA